MTVSSEQFRMVPVVLSVVVAILGILAWIRWARSTPHAKVWAIAPIWYFAQVVAFYVADFARSAGLLPILQGNMHIISAALRLEGVIILAGSAVLMLYRLQTGKRAERWNSGRPS